MTSLISTNVASVKMFYVTADTNMMNTYHVRLSAGWTNSDLEALETAFEDWEGTLASAERSDLVVLDRIICTDLTSLTSGNYDKQVSPPIAGQQPSEILPANSTIAIKGNIGERGRGRAPRIFWIGLTIGQVTEDSIDQAAATSLVAALDGLQGLITAAVPGAELGVIHTVVAGVHVPDAPFSPIYNWVLTDLALDSQKDRLPRHKKHKRS